jgi:hypothetical protein
MPKAEDKYFMFKGEEEINPDFLETFPFDSPNPVHYDGDR